MWSKKGERRANSFTAAPPAKLEDLQVLRLWSGAAPGQQGEDPATDIPTLTVYLPPTGKANGAAMIVFPGGAYSHLSPREGLPTVQWLARNGITAAGQHRGSTSAICTALNAWWPTELDRKHNYLDQTEPN